MKHNVDDIVNTKSHTFHFSRSKTFVPGEKNFNGPPPSILNNFTSNNIGNRELPNVVSHHSYVTPPNLMAQNQEYATQQLRDITRLDHSKNGQNRYSNENISQYNPKGGGGGGITNVMNNSPQPLVYVSNRSHMDENTHNEPSEYAYQLSKYPLNQKQNQQFDGNDRRRLNDNSNKSNFGNYNQSVSDTSLMRGRTPGFFDK